MTLKDCTKEELIYCVNYIAGRFGLHNKDYYIESALGNVEYERQRKKLDKAEEFNQLSAKKRKEYVSLLKPYEGKKYFDVPLEVINKASVLMKEAEKADKEYDKIMKEVL